VDGVEKLTKLFHDKGGFVEEPDKYTRERQDDVLEKIKELGRLVYDLFSADGGGHLHPLQSWLFGLNSEMTADERHNIAGGSNLEKNSDGRRARPRGERPTLPVTIITNDFNIPWYWLRGHYDGKALCEICSLGTLHLKDVAENAIPSNQRGGNDTCRVLLLNGRQDMPFSEQILEGIRRNLEKSSRLDPERLLLHRICSSRADLNGILGQDGEAERDVRLMHFSGCFKVSEKQDKSVALVLNGEDIPKWRITAIVEDCLLVLDGITESCGAKAWTDWCDFTTEVISKGCALGCVLPVLPVKDDPIVSGVFWDAFYKNLARGDCIAGYALAMARKDLKDHFEKLGSQNPLPLFYQLIGSPLVTVFQQE
jgi:hypothetical protein